MSIEKTDYENIIRSLILGNPVAEHDSILQAARVDTPVFDGVINDAYDIVTGRKGAGKTAIFKVMGEELKSFFLVSKKQVMLSGVNSQGESIFNQFKDDFEKFTEDDFENFWKLYFISLIYNHFIKAPEFAGQLSDCQAEIDDFKKACQKAGIPDIPAIQDRLDMLRWILRIFKSIKKVKGTAGIEPTNTSLFGTSLEIEFKDNIEDSTHEVKSLYVNEIGVKLKEILKKSGLKIWIILDRLDEVFERYSMIEFNGLRGLLRAYKSFDVMEGSDLFRVKLFLRDDIKEFLTDNAVFKKYYPKNEIPPLVAATHIFAKESPVLSWSQDEISQLILYRLLQSDPMKNFVGINVNNRNDLQEQLRSKDMRLKCWNKIFPEKIANSPSLTWIYTRLRDSNGVVTPRSVIDMLTAATDYQKKNIQINFEDSSHIYPVESLKEGIAVASINKLEKDIYNEFPKDQESIKKLGQYGKHKLSKKDLTKIYGKDSEKIADSLKRIGILRFIKNSNEYMVEFLFRPALGITYKY